VTRPGTAAETDPLAIVRAHLIGHAAVDAELARHISGGDDSLGGTGERILTVVRPPYPMLRIALLNHDPGEMLWRSVADVQIEAWGDTDGTITGDDLRRLLMVAMTACKDLETRTYRPDEPVVNHVQGGGPGAPLEDPDTKQLYYVGSVALTLHPAFAVT
jgi:hypothetical protein